MKVLHAEFKDELKRVMLPSSEGQGVRLRYGNDYHVFFFISTLTETLVLPRSEPRYAATLIDRYVCHALKDASVSAVITKQFQPRGFLWKSVTREHIADITENCIPPASSNFPWGKISNKFCTYQCSLKSDGFSIH